MAKAGVDPEIEAIGLVGAALSELDEDTARRVLDWASRKYLRKGVLKEERFEGGDKHDGLPPKSSVPKAGHHVSEDIADYFSRAKPATEHDKVLVVAHWHQTRADPPEVDSQKVNETLKHMGHRVSNVTRAFETLISQKPQQVIQTRKEGKAKQARKKYKVTREGVLRIAALMEGGEQK